MVLLGCTAGLCSAAGHLRDQYTNPPRRRPDDSALSAAEAEGRAEPGGHAGHPGRAAEQRQPRVGAVQDVRDTVKREA